MLLYLRVQIGGDSRLPRGANVASPGLVPEIRPEIFDGLKTIAIAMDAARNDRQNTQELLWKLQESLSNCNPFNTPNLISTIENMILSALYCGTIMERREVKALMVDSAANARRQKKVVSQQIDEVIKSVILARYGRMPKSTTANAIATKIQSDVSRGLTENNIGNRELGVSAITKRVKKLIKLDG
jgi:hypothetical protein